MIAAERRDFHLGAAIPHQNHAEMRSHEIGFWKERRNLVGPGLGRDIIIFRNFAQQQIAYAASHEVRLVAARFQFRYDLPGQL